MVVATVVSVAVPEDHGGRISVYEAGDGIGEGSLSPAERRIMRGIADGKSSKEIAEELSAHYRTVENHRTRICRKLSLEREGANALLRYALQNRNLL